MTTLSRRSFTALAGLATVGAAVPMRYAKAAEFSFKLGTNVPETHPLNVYAKKAAEELAQTTDGRFELQIFANNQLGGDSDMFSQLRSGALECFTLSGVNVLSTLIPSAAIWGVGFAWKDYPTLWNALDGKFGAHLRSQIDKAGLVVMDKIWDNGFRQTTTSTKPVQSPDDFRGMKLRVPPSPLWTSMFKAFDAAPASINFNEVYSALQTKIVDGQENPLAIISTAKLYEVQKYCSLTNHMWDGFWFLANRRAWERLPDDVRVIVTKHVNAAGVAQRADVEKLNANLQQDLASKGLVFNKPNPEPFRDKLRAAGFYAEWKGKYGEEAWTILEKAVGRLA